MMMSVLARWRLAIALVSPCVSLAASQDSQLTGLVRTIGAAVNTDHAMETMRRVYETDRWFTFPKFQQTAEYLKRRMTDVGLQQVELLEAPADGVTQAGYWTMPMAWDVKQARLEIVEPAAPAEFRVLADYESVPASLGMWSGPTPPGGVTAEVIELDSTEPAAIRKLDLQGKLVLTSRNPAEFKWLLARKGALGAINAFTENPSLKDGRQWINSWGDNGWAFIKTSSPLLCFSITPRQAKFLRGYLRGGGKVRVKATVDSRHYAGVYPYVTAVLPGSNPEEEVLTLGHTSEQGAHDNATGVAAMVESLATLHRLIQTGRLPRPRRTIRILTMPEMYGSLHYVTTHPERMRRTVAAMCVDTPAGFYNLAGTEYTFYMNPHVAKSYTDALVLRVAEAYLGRLSTPRPWHWKEFMTGTDTYLAEPAVDVPTVWPYSGTGVHSHHNSEDKPDTVDPQSLRDLTAINAIYLYYVASAQEPEALWLAQITLDRGYRQVLDAASRALDRTLTQPGGADLAVSLQQGLDQIAYSVDRESSAVRSVLRLAPGMKSSALDPAVAALQKFGSAQADRLRAAVPVAPQSPPDPQLAEASKILVKRKRIGTLPLDDLPPDQREGYPSGAWSSVPIIALYWCDGHRSLAGVIRLTRLELGPSNFDFVGYFRFLERHGYVEFAH